MVGPVYPSKGDTYHVWRGTLYSREMLFPSPLLFI
jgi:hypothetical protein